jgi:hypothetical protein
MSRKFNISLLEDTKAFIPFLEDETQPHLIVSLAA